MHNLYHCVGTWSIVFDEVVCYWTRFLDCRLQVKTKTLELTCITLQVGKEILSLVSINHNTEKVVVLLALTRFCWTRTTPKSDGHCPFAGYSFKKCLLVCECYEEKEPFFHCSFSKLQLLHGFNLLCIKKIFAEHIIRIFISNPADLIS